MQRAPWEAQQLLREELSTVLSNRSAAYFENGDLVSAITDADTVIQLKKPWSKGHFRKAKALIAIGLLEQAKEAVQYGLQFDPTNVEMMGVLQDIEFVLRSYANQPRPGNIADLAENTSWFIYIFSTHTPRIVSTKPNRRQWPSSICINPPWVCRTSFPILVYHPQHHLGVIQMNIATPNPEWIQVQCDAT